MIRVTKAVANNNNNNHEEGVSAVTTLSSNNINRNNNDNGDEVGEMEGVLKGEALYVCEGDGGSKNGGGGERTLKVECVGEDGVGVCKTGHGEGVSEERMEKIKDEDGGCGS